MSLNTLLAARLSLSFLWIFTAITSAFFVRDLGYDILSRGGINGLTADLCLYGGSLMDAVLGGWLLTNRRLKWCYLIQLYVIIIYSILLTFIAPDFWLHPFGPLSKNIPILMLVYILYLFDSQSKKLCVRASQDSGEA